MNVTHIRVTNSNDFAIPERFDGIHYTFEPGVARLLPLDAAALIFGLPIDDNGNLEIDDNGIANPDWTYVQRRWGWNTVSRRKDEEMAEAVQRSLDDAAMKCSKLKLEAVSMALREVPMKADEALPAPREGATDEDSADHAPMKVSAVPRKGGIQR